MVYSPSIIIDVLTVSLRDITLTNDMCDGLIKTVKFVKPTDPKNPWRIDIIVHAHHRNGAPTQHFTYKNASHDQIKENLEWVQSV